jgi:hypothetical protein
MNSTLRKVILSLITILFSSSLLAFNSAPSYAVEIKLGFQNKLTCELSDFKGGKGNVKGRTNISHNENDISWTSTCLIQLPTTVNYCLISSQSIDSPDAFLSYFSGFQKKVIRAKIISESDVNPGFGQFSVNYYCFE